MVPVRKTQPRPSRTSRGNAGGIEWLLPIRTTDGLPYIQPKPSQSAKKQRWSGGSVWSASTRHWARSVSRSRLPTSGAPPDQAIVRVTASPVRASVAPAIACHCISGWGCRPVAAQTSAPNGPEVASGLACQAPGEERTRRSSAGRLSRPTRRMVRAVVRSSRLPKHRSPAPTRSDPRRSS